MTYIDETHDPKAQSWLEDANGHSDFPLQNLPLGVFSPEGDDKPRGGIAIGDHILDLGGLESHLSGDAALAAKAAGGSSLNALFALGAGPRRALRRAVFALLTDSTKENLIRPLLFSATPSTLYLPAHVGDYTDFYTGINHAENVGKLFRPDNPLLPNYKYVPIGYHGRASSIRVSGTNFPRPKGQIKTPDASEPAFGPCHRLDYELEMGIWVSHGNDLGDTIPIASAKQHIAGLCLLNDWSARDIQAWEYQPLGPFLAKNFISTVSPWVITTEALAPYQVAQPARPEDDPKPLAYLSDAEDQKTGAYNVIMEVHILTEKMRAAGEEPCRLSKGNMSAMYWTAAQLVAHHASGGCNLQPGDLLGTGTLSGADSSSYGSLLELSNGGKAPITLPNGETRTFLEDNDELILSAYAERENRVRIGFGSCRGKVQPAR
ncbi:fumarylacetoacetase [Kordiimonas pumila]|uniref:fumarylacetoacetase n=1 Tax=Kordiimonas pumila TaxID=2161677 RepID=A0ABV7D715_9PROT|nr:fumarylacetoacetase [Kordiimonas pumila]